MKKRRDIVEVVKSWCVIIGTTLCYIVLSLINVYFYHHVAPLEPPSGEVDLAKVIIEVLSNSITIAAGATDGFVRMWQKRNFTKENCNFCDTLFCAYRF